MEEQPPIWRVVVNMLSKWSHTTVSGGGGCGGGGDGPFNFNPLAY
jgi:hypothetical protein